MGDSKPHSVSLSVSELLRKHQAGTLEMASGPRCMTSAEQAEVLDTLGSLIEQLEAARLQSSENFEAMMDERRKSVALERAAGHVLDAYDEYLRNPDGPRMTRLRDAIGITLRRATSNPASRPCSNCGGTGEDMNWLEGVPVRCSKCEGSGEA